jgi:hypothetical protein
MAYRTLITCSECGKEENVPQLNAQPKNWVTLGWIKTRTDENLQPVGNEMVIDHFCGWQDAYKFVRRFVKKEDDSE